MAKARTSYLCRECGGVQTQWMGKCPDCGTWDALEKYTEPKITAANAAAAAIPSSLEGWVSGSDGGETHKHGRGANSANVGGPKAVSLPDVEAADVARFETGIGEFDRVLGGGLVRGSVVLVAGDPGIGKSTLLLQAAGKMAANDAQRVLYVSSEESAFQTRMRAERLFGVGGGGAGEGRRQKTGEQGGTTRYHHPPDGEEAQSILVHAERGGTTDLDNVYVLADTNLARIIEQARQVQPRVLIIDSIQMIFKSEVDAAPGSVTQLRRCCLELVYLAKLTGMAVVLVGHVTKQGQIAGPKLLEHLVDTVLSFEGDRHHAHRVVRAIKNRFGTTLEIALFEMSSSGLREAPDGAFLQEAARENRTGAVICPAMHGSRCLLAEVQALTATGFLGNARRKASGVDTNRLAMIIAVLEKHGGLRLADQDIFASTAGGLKLTEPGTDLALAFAIAGAHFNRVLPVDVAVIGEVGLGGEVRRVNAMAQRLRECARLGFKSVIVPKQAVDEAEGVDAIELIPVGGVAAAIEHLQPASQAIAKS